MFKASLLSMLSLVALIGCGMKHPVPMKVLLKQNQQWQKSLHQHKSKSRAPKPAQEPLMGEAAPSLLVTQAWFWKDEMEIHSRVLLVWKSGVLNKMVGSVFAWKTPTRMSFTKPFPFQDGILTIGAERALLKHWTMADGKWTQKRCGNATGRVSSIDFAMLKWGMSIMTVSRIWIATHDAGVVCP